MKKDLDHYFQLAKSSKPFVSHEEVLKSLSHRKDSTKSRSLTQPLRWAAAILILSTMVISYFQLDFSEVEVAESSDDQREMISFARHALMNSIDKPGTGASSIEIKSVSNQTTYPSQVPIIEVSTSIMQQLGFSFQGAQVVYEANVIGHGYLYVSFSHNSHALTVNDSHSDKTTFLSSVYPMFISDVNGYQKTKYAFATEQSGKTKSEFFNAMINELVPIAIPDPQNSSSYLGIFWFESTMDLYEILDKDLSKQIASLKTIDESVKKNENGLIAQINNPVSETLEISLTIDKKISPRIEIRSVYGEVIKVITDQPYYLGTHNIESDLSDLENGIYVVSVSTEEQNLSQRIIKI